MGQDRSQRSDIMSACQNGKRCGGWHGDVYAGIFIASSGLPYS